MTLGAALGGFVRGALQDPARAAEAQERVVDWPPQRTALPAAIEWRYADGSRLTYTGRDAVVVDRHISGAEACWFIHGGKGESPLAGVRWTHRTADGEVTRGTCPGRLDALRVVDFGDREARHLRSPVLARLFPQKLFLPVRLPSDDEPPAKLERVVVVTPSLDELTSGTEREPCPLLDDDAGVIRFLEEHAPRLDDAAATRDAAVAFALLRGLADPEGEPDIGVDPTGGGGWRVTIRPPGGEPVRLVVREGRLRLDPGGGGRK